MGFIGHQNPGSGFGGCDRQGLGSADTRINMPTTALNVRECGKCGMTSAGNGLLRCLSYFFWHLKFVTKPLRGFTKWLRTAFLVSVLFLSQNTKALDSCEYAQQYIEIWQYQVQALSAAIAYWTEHEESNALNLRPGLDQAIKELSTWISYKAQICGIANTPGLRSGNNAQTTAAPSDRGANSNSHAADPLDMATGGHLIRRGFFPGMLSDAPGLILEHLSFRTTENIVGRSWSHDWSARLSYDSMDDAVTIQWTSTRANRFNRASPTDPWRSAQWDVRFDRVTAQPGGGWRLERQSGDSWEFDAAGFLSSRVNRHGRRISVGRDASQRVSTLTDSITGRALTFMYDGSGRLLVVRDPLNREIHLAYNTEGDLELLTDPAGNATLYAYNSAGQVLTAADQEGRVLFTNTYDSSGRVVSQTDGVAGHSATNVIYNEELYPGRIVTVLTDRLGNRCIYIHDDQYRLVSAADALSRTLSFMNLSPGSTGITTDYVTSPRYEALTIKLDANGNLLSIADAYGTRETSIYDAAGNRTSLADGLGHSTTFAYNSARSLTSITDARSKTTQINYNTAQQPLTRTLPRGGVMTWSYNAGGVLQSMTNEVNATTQYTHDAAGRLTGMTDPASGTTSWVRDGMDRVTQATDPLNRQWHWTYDSHGHVLSATDPAGRVTLHTYDGNGNRITTRDPLNGLTTYAYDAEDNLTSVTDPAGRVIEHQYDAAGRRIGTRLAPALDWATQILNQAGDVIATYSTRWPMSANYDVRGRLRSLSNGATQTRSFNYDGFNVGDRLTQATDPLGRQTQFAYDDADNLTQVTEPGGAQALLSYDDDGNLASVTDPNGQTTGYTHDLAGRMTAESVPGVGSIQYGYNSRDLLTSRTNARGQQATLAYDAAGRLITRSDPVGTIQVTNNNVDNVTAITEGARTLAFEYDALDRVTRFTDADGNVIEYAYDGAGNLTSLTYPGGRVVTYGYDAAGRLTTVTDWAGRTTTYTWDSISRLTGETKANGVSTTRAYDAAGRLTQLRTTKDGTVIAQFDLTHDAADNVLTENRQGVDDFFPPSVKMTTGADNRLATVNGQAVAYDADGNMTSGPDRNGVITPYTYDARDRLTAHGGVTHSYDALDQRVALTTIAGTTRLVIDPVSEPSQVLIRTDAAGNQTFYIHGIGLIAEDGPSGYRAYHYDSRGSTVALTDATGQVTHRFAYGPYGEYAGDPAAAPTPFLFNGRDGVMTDPDGLYQMRSRFYHPLVKRFVNRDVWSGEAAAPQTLNRYAYATGNPVSLIDPFGTSPLDSDAAAGQPLSDAGGAQAQGPVFGPPSPLTPMQALIRAWAEGQKKQRSDYAEYLNRTKGKKQMSLEVRISKIRNGVTSPVSDKGRFLIKTKSTTLGVRG